MRRADLQFLVLDELHTYRGRQGADVALLVRRAAGGLPDPAYACVGTSATMASGGTLRAAAREVAGVATRLFGPRSDPANVIGETLHRATTHANLERSETTRSHSGSHVAAMSRRRPSTSSSSADPLAGWIEDRLGLRRDAEGGRLIRGEPRPIVGARGVPAN